VTSGASSQESGDINWRDWRERETREALPFAQPSRNWNFYLNGSRADNIYIDGIRINLFSQTV
jgi:hypothetical protein